MSNATGNQIKLSSLIDVRTYGAKGDGVTDDSAAIQAAINAAAGRAVLLSAGDYLVNTGLTVGTNSHLVGAPGATLLAGANAITVLATAAGFRSGVKLTDVTVDGNGKTGVTAIRYSNVQFNSTITGANVNDCANGVILEAVCIGVHVDRPTIYGTVTGIQILTSNACVVTCPSIDHQTGSAPLTGTGIYLTGATNVVHGGFVQGFQYGVYDSGDYNKVDGTYFELCTDCAIRWEGCKLPTAEDVFFFGYNATPSAAYTVVASDTAGGRVLRPRMVQGNSTGGLFFFSSGNTGCATDYATDGGTTNTAAGTVTQITQIAIP